MRRNRACCIALLLLFTLSFSKKMEVTVKTKSYGGITAPRHTASIWIQQPGNKYVKTLGLWSYGYNFCLMNWRTVTGLLIDGEYDGETGATLADHTKALKVVWDCKDTNGVAVPNGTYEFCVEMAESEYYWKIHDPNEVYIGRYSKGTIVIDDEKKEVLGDTISDTCFSGFKASYDPNTAIAVPQVKHKQSAWYAEISYGLVTLTLQKQVPFGVDVFDLKGKKVWTAESITTQKLSLPSSEIGTRGSSSGVYLFKVYNLTDSKQIGSVRPVSLLK